VGLLAAYADLGASFAFGRLLALKTKHGVSSLMLGVSKYGAVNGAALSLPHGFFDRCPSSTGSGRRCP
ncbi:MAG TPA: hypothetical protein VLT88_03955, partial [Desulfosarcina sp.]|nr:hypothetical protein [Desulfosarcina sp.]